MSTNGKFYYFNHNFEFRHEHAAAKLLDELQWRRSKLTSILNATDSFVHAEHGQPWRIVIFSAAKPSAAAPAAHDAPSVEPGPPAIADAAQWLVAAVIRLRPESSSPNAGTAPAEITVFGANALIAATALILEPDGHHSLVAAVIHGPWLEPKLHQLGQRQLEPVDDEPGYQAAPRHGEPKQLP